MQGVPAQRAPNSATLRGMIRIHTCAGALALALVVAGGAAAQQKGSTPPPIGFVKVWNDGPESFDELEGKVVILDFGATW